MPTGYTAPVADGNTNVRDFMLDCVKAFGAFYHLRDEHNPTATRELPAPSSYHTGALARAEAEVKRWSSISVDAAAAMQLTEKEKSDAYYEKSMAEDAVKLANYTEVLDGVRAWTPPTEDHQNYKDFMVKQLEQSIEFDCGYKPSRYELVPVEEFIQTHLDRARQDVAYHTEHLAKEEKANRDRQAWVDAFFDSLPSEG